MTIFGNLISKVPAAFASGVVTNSHNLLSGMSASHKSTLAAVVGGLTASTTTDLFQTCVVLAIGKQQHITPELVILAGSAII